MPFGSSSSLARVPTSSKRWRGLLRVVSYTLWRVSRRGAKALGLQDDSYFLNLFRLCLDAWIGFSHKNPSAQASQRGGRAGSPNERGLPRSEGETKNIYHLSLNPSVMFGTGRANPKGVRLDY